MNGETGKSRATIAATARRLIATLRHELGKLMICSYPSDPSMIGIPLNRVRGIWQDRLGRIHVAGRSSHQSHGSDISSGNTQSS